VTNESLEPAIQPDDERPALGVSYLDDQSWGTTVDEWPPGETELDPRPGSYLLEFFGDDGTPLGRAAQADTTLPLDYPIPPLAVRLRLTALDFRTVEVTPEWLAQVDEVPNCGGILVFALRHRDGTAQAMRSMAPYRCVVISDGVRRECAMAPGAVPSHMVFFQWPSHFGTGQLAAPGFSCTYEWYGTDEDGASFLLARGAYSRDGEGNGWHEVHQ
jgi:hypothetical protein